MMRVPALYRDKKPVISFEFFPFRDSKTQETFNRVIDGLSPLTPDYYSVTFGAGGSNREGSYDTVKTLIKDRQLPTVAYIAGYGLGPEDIRQVLDHYQDLGVETIFVLRGDKPREEGFTPHPDSFANASDLIEFIRSNYRFSLGCAGYPEGHVEAKTLESDIQFLKLKQDKGAEYSVVQYFYDNEFYFSYVDKCRNAGIEIPIIPGIMPVYTLKLTKILSRVCGAAIPPALQKKIDGVDPDNASAVLDMGIEYALGQCRGLLEKGVPGLHFYTMNRDRSTWEIVETLKKENLI